jgi:NTE family protein
MTPDHKRPHHLDTLLMQHPHAALPDLEPAAIDLLRRHLSWVEVAGGQTLMVQGESGDAMYLPVSGRLRTTIRQDDGKSRRSACTCHESICRAWAPALKLIRCEK